MVSPSRRYWKVAFYGSAALVFLLSVVPSYDYLPGAFRINDKINHFVAFFMLSLLFDAAYGSLPVPGKGGILLFYGLAIELVQFFLPYRECSIVDWSVDIVAIAFYFAASRFVSRFLKHAGKSC